MTYPDIAQALQARILENAEQMADTPRNRPDELRSVGAMEVQNAILEEAVATADALGEQRRQEAASAAKRVEILEAKIATLKEAVVKGEAVGEQQRQEAQAATNRANELVAKIADMTSAGQAAAKRDRDTGGQCRHAGGSHQQGRRRGREAAPGSPGGDQTG